MTSGVADPVDLARGIADALLARVRHQDRVWGTYAIDLALDAMLEFHLAAGAPAHRDYALAVLYRRNLRLADEIDPDGQPFGHVNYNLFRVLGDGRVADAFVRGSRRLRATVSRSHDGLVQHRVRPDAPPRVLVDFMQDYISRMARTGVLLGEVDWFAECATQVRLYRDLLRDPDTGLWHQGRGWEPDDPEAISPGAWSRGQGWVLRGLTDALQVLPVDQPERRELQTTLRELLDALLVRQRPDGLWSVLVDQPSAASSPETSGTALIAMALYRALLAGHVSGERYLRAADRAFGAVARQVDAEGRVYGACAGPGPLDRATLERSYLGRGVVAEEEDHGWFSVLYACAARVAHATA